MSQEDTRQVAIVYCEGAFNTTNGKTAHGLVRRTDRYRVVSVVDSSHEGKDAGEVIDQRPAGIPLVSSVEQGMEVARARGLLPTHLVVGLAPDGGRLSPRGREDIRRGLELGLHVVCGLHDFLTEDPELVSLAGRMKVTLTDVRKPKPRKEHRFFTGKIEEVTSATVALLGTDSAVGKRTTAWLLIDALKEAGHTAELVGTGQTAWLQGVRYGVIMDSLVNDFVSGEIENAVHTAFVENHPDFIVVEGQGSLLNPAYPGGFEILAASRPRAVVLQHAPARKDYDGFPGFPIHPLSHQIDAVEIISGKPVVAITVNHESLSPAEALQTAKSIEEETGLCTCVPLVEGVSRLVGVLRPFLSRR